MKQLKLSRKEKREIVKLYNDDFYDDMIQQYFNLKHHDFYEKVFEETCSDYGITKEQYENENDLGIDYGDFSLDFMYNLLIQSGVDLQMNY